MKRVVKSIVRRAWGLTSPVRRPISRKLNAWADRTLAVTVKRETEPKLDLLLHVMNVSRQEASAYRTETNLIIDSLVREVSRLQDEVETLRIEMQEQRLGSGPLGLTGVEREASAA